jgi:4a-hydroxytetrahydrobiopterin dehydratase
MLANQSCVSVSKEEKPINENDARSMLGQIEGWALAEKGKAIFRKFTFSNFDEAYALAQKIASIAQQQNHHPDINFGWGYVKVRLMTHDIGGLHKNDFVMAYKINSIL